MIEPANHLPAAAPTAHLTASDGRVEDMQEQIRHTCVAVVRLEKFQALHLISVTLLPPTPTPTPTHPPDLLTPYIPWLSIVLEACAIMTVKFRQLNEA